MWKLSCCQFDVYVGVCCSHCMCAFQTFCPVKFGVHLNKERELVTLVKFGHLLDDLHVTLF